LADQDQILLKGKFKIVLSAGTIASESRPTIASAETKRPAPTFGRTNFLIAHLPPELFQLIGYASAPTYVSNHEVVFG